jgi:hypothetical protein
VDQEVCQAPFEAVIRLVPPQDLQRGVKLSSGPPLRRAKHRDQVSDQRQGVWMNGQSPGHNRVAVQTVA